MNPGTPPRVTAAYRMLADGRGHLAGERYRRARRSLDVARARFDDACVPVTAARVEFELGIVLMVDGWYAEASESLGRAAAFFEERGDRGMAGRCRVWKAAARRAAGEIAAARRELRAVEEPGAAADPYAFAVVSGRVAVELGDLDEAERSFDHAERVRPETSSGIELALSRAILDSARGRLESAEQRLLGALASVPATGGRRDQARLRRRLGSVLRDRGRLEEARAEFDAARGEFAELGLGVDVAECDLRIGRLEAVRGRYPMAEGRLRAARRVFSRMRLPLHVATCDRVRAVVAAETGRLDAATDLLAGARVALVRGRRWREVGDCDRELADVHLAAGRTGLAVRALIRARRRYWSLDNEVGALWCDRGIAVATAQGGDDDAACRLLESTIEGFESVDLPLDAAHCLRDLGGIHVSRSAREEARQALARARAVFEREHLTADVAWCDALDAEALALGGREQDLREALVVGVPAVSVLHAERYGFRGAGERTAWMRTLDPHVESLAEWAWRIGDHRLLVDLVETAVNVGVRSPAGAPEPGAEGARDSGVLLALRPPPRLRMPGATGHLALDPWLGDPSSPRDRGEAPVDVR